MENGGLIDNKIIEWGGSRSGINVIFAYLKLDGESKNRADGET
jgi:hypothetical protein